MEERSIKKAITRKFPKISFDDTLEDAIKKMTAHNVSVLAVKVEEELIGLVTISDVMYSLSQGHNMKETRLSEFMTKCEFDVTKETRNPCLQLDEDENIYSAIKVMYESGVNHLLVSGVGGKPVGIVSSLDLVKLYGSELMEPEGVS